MFDNNHGYFGRLVRHIFPFIPAFQLEKILWLVKDIARHRTASTLKHLDDNMGSIREGTPGDDAELMRSHLQKECALITRYIDENYTSMFFNDLEEACLHHGLNIVYIRNSDGTYFASLDEFISLEKKKVIVEVQRKYNDTIGVDTATFPESPKFSCADKLINIDDLYGPFPDRLFGTLLPWLPKYQIYRGSFLLKEVVSFHHKKITDLIEKGMGTILEKRVSDVLDGPYTKILHSLFLIREREVLIRNIREHHYDNIIKDFFGSCSYKGINIKHLYGTESPIWADLDKYINFMIDRLVSEVTDKYKSAIGGDDSSVMHAGLMSVLNDPSPETTDKSTNNPHPDIQQESGFEAEHSNSSENKDMLDDAYNKGRSFGQTLCKDSEATAVRLFAHATETIEEIFRTMLLDKVHTCPEDFANNILQAVHASLSEPHIIEIFNTKYFNNVNVNSHNFANMMLLCFIEALSIRLNEGITKRIYDNYKEHLRDIFDGEGSDLFVAMIKKVVSTVIDNNILALSTSILTIVEESAKRCNTLYN